MDFFGQIPTLILAPFAGVLVDRRDRHRILLVTQLLSMLQSVALAVLTFAGVITVAHILILQVAQGIINVFDTPARQAFVVEMVEDRLRQFAVDRRQLVQSFLSAYPSLCQDAATRLRGLYNPTDYPGVDEAAREFGFSWQYVSFGVPEQLKGISREVWEQEREKAAVRMAEASTEIQVVLRETMAKLVQHMADRLKTGPDGKPLRFKETTVENLVEFLMNFEFRNVTDDNELQALVSQARDLMQGVTADDLRTTGDLRSKLQQGMTGIAGQLDALLMRTGGRKFRFDEEE